MKKYKNTILSIIVIIGFLIGLIWISQSPKNLENNFSSSGNVLSAQELLFDFGTISMAAGNVTHEFTINNSGTEPITIKRLYTSCMCTTASLITSQERIGPFGMPGHGFMPRLNETILSGEEAIIEVVFDPTAHGPAGIGLAERVVYVENNAGSPLQLKFKAMVKP